MLMQSVINGIPESLQKEASKERDQKQQSAVPPPEPPPQAQRDASVPQEIFQGGNSTEIVWLDLWHFDSKTCLN